MFVRSSRMPTAMACPASLQAPGYLVNDDSDPARLGTAVHEALGMKLVGKPVSDEQFELIAVKYTLPVDDIRKLFFQGWQLLHDGNILKYFPTPEVEAEVESSILYPVEMRGHIDLLYYESSSKTIHVLDHKTGWLDTDHTHQIKAYGFQALEKYSEADRVHTIVARVRDFTTEHETYTKEELMAWGTQVKKRLVDERDVYSPGKHCTFCPHRLNCVAYSDWVRRSIQLLLGADDTTIANMSPDKIGELYAAKSNLKRVIKDVEDVLKSLASTAKGSLDCGDAYELRLESEIHTEILFKESWPVLSETVDESEWNTVFKVKKTALDKVVKAGAAHGQKTKHWKDLLDRLTEMEAVNQTEETKFVHRKKSLPMIEG